MNAINSLEVVAIKIIKLCHIKTTGWRTTVICRTVCGIRWWNSGWIDAPVIEMLKSVLRLQALSTGKRMPSNFSVYTGVQITWSSCSLTQSEKQFQMTQSTLMNTLTFLSGVCRCRHKTTVSINCRMFSYSLGELLASVVRAGRCNNVNWPADAAFNDNLDAFVR